MCPPNKKNVFINSGQIRVCPPNKKNVFNNSARPRMSALAFIMKWAVFNRV